MKPSRPIRRHAAAFCLLALALTFSCRASSPAETMGPLLAGRWYPADAKALASEVDGMMAASPAEAVDEAAVLIVPHAGYQYSGKVAGCGYAALRASSPGVIVILAPSHQARLEGCAVLPADRYGTPLGEVRLDRKAAGKLAGTRLFTASREAFAHEHALEIQLPFLQRLFGAKLGTDIAVLPVLVGKSARPTQGVPPRRSWKRSRGKRGRFLS
jgi:AmmeMemoRadiSam system protein B